MTMINRDVEVITSTEFIKTQWWSNTYAGLINVRHVWRSFTGDFFCCVWRANHLADCLRRSLIIAAFCLAELMLRLTSVLTKRHAGAPISG
jgi:hypothetical protein